MDARERLEQVRERWNAASLRVRVGVLAGVAVALTAGALWWASNAEPDRAVLFSNLAQRDAAQIVERLRAMNVDYALDDGGQTIRVPEDSVHETRLTLANEGLPSGGGVGFEIFDAQRFGESDFSEQVRFRRALEGELARTIGHLAGVDNARVHLVLPERTLFASEERGASASVALHLRPGWRVRDEQVRGVSHLVASSVPGLSPENVTVVDGDGRPLSTGEGETEATSSDVSENRTRIERARQRAVQQLLDASLGPGVAVVRVSADVDVSREEHVEETYDPERVATRSFEVSEERDPSAAGGAQGVPGAASNLPGGPAAETETAEGAVARRTERRNFEITKTVRRAVRPVGRLRRLTVAVVVDGHWEGEGDARAFEPRTDEELARIRSLVTSAAGVDTERGDAVTVECVPFAASSEPPVEPELGPLAEYEPYFPYAGAAAAALLVLLVLLVWWIRRRRARRRAEEEAAARAQLGEGADELDAPYDLAPEQAASAPSPESLDRYEELRALAVEVARRDPELAARVVRGWLAEDAKAAAAAEAQQEEAA